MGSCLAKFFGKAQASAKKYEKVRTDDIDVEGGGGLVSNVPRRSSATKDAEDDWGRDSWDVEPVTKPAASLNSGTSHVAIVPLTSSASGGVLSSALSGGASSVSLSASSASSTILRKASPPVNSWKKDDEEDAWADDDWETPAPAPAIVREASPAPPVPMAFPVAQSPAPTLISLPLATSLSAPPATTSFSEKAMPMASSGLALGGSSLKRPPAKAVAAPPVAKKANKSDDLFASMGMDMSPASYEKPAVVKSDKGRASSSKSLVALASDLGESGQSEAWMGEELDLDI